jgi:hypothetical protein
MENATRNPARNRPAVRLLICLAAAALIAIAAWEHRAGLNGTSYHRWNWRNTLGGWRYAIFILLAAPFFAGQWLRQRHPKRTSVSLLLVMLTAGGLMGAFIILQSRTPSTSGIIYVIQNQYHFGYFRDAEKLLEAGIPPRQMLADYPRLCRMFTLHPRVKPPGLILIDSLVIAVFGPDRRGELAIAALIGLGAVFALPAVYSFVAEFTQDADAAFAAASYFALCPALLLIFPQFDQCYPLLTVALAITWRRTLVNNSAYLAAQFGLILAITLFVTYLPAVLVVLFAAYPFVLRRQGNSPTSWQATRLALVSLFAFVAFYALLWLATGFNPVAGFRACWANQAGNLRFLESIGNIPRRWPGTIPGDFSDFALGAGWIAFLLAAMFFVPAGRAPRPFLALGALCIGQIAIVGLLGLIQCETARVWIFMLPLLMLPVGVEIGHWTFGPRMAIYLALLVLVVATWHSMSFFI